MKVEDLPLSTWARNALMAEGLLTTDDVIKFGIANLHKRIPNIGIVIAAEISAAVLPYTNLSNKTNKPSQLDRIEGMLKQLLPQYVPGWNDPRKDPAITQEAERITAAQCTCSLTTTCQLHSNIN